MGTHPGSSAGGASFVTFNQLLQKDIVEVMSVDSIRETKTRLRIPDRLSISLDNNFTLFNQFDTINNDIIHTRTLEQIVHQGTVGISAIKDREPSLPHIIVSELDLS